MKRFTSSGFVRNAVAPVASSVSTRAAVASALDDDDRELTRDRVFLEPQQHFLSVHDREVEVQQDQVGPVLPGKLQAEACLHRGEQPDVATQVEDPLHAD